MKNWIGSLMQTRKPTVKPGMLHTLHKDGTVSYFSIVEQRWRREFACTVSAKELATMPESGRRAVLGHAKRGDS